jgi:hypothetical protein
MTLSFFGFGLRVSVVAVAGAVAAAGSSLAACSSTSSASGTVPPGLGISCSTTTSASDAASARTTLAGAAAGTCVVLPAGTYAGPFTVPPGVAFVAQNGSRATITGGTAQEPAVSLGEGSQLGAFDLVDSGGVGVAVRAANAVVSNVTVTGAKNAAVAVLCREATTPGCASGTVTMTDVLLTKSTLGLWVSGAHLSWKGGGSASHAGTALAAAAGVVAQDGARLELENVTVEKNEGVGVLLDGAKTTASIKNATVNENGERGIWAQRVNGTIEAPALRIEGSQITKNKVVGVGAMESHGIIIVSGRIADTVAAPLVTNLESTEQIGDGLGLFAGSGDLKIDGSLFETNARAAGVIDGSDRGIIIVSGKVGAGDSGLKFVIQNSKTTEIQIADGDRSVPPKALGISAPTLALPPVL